MLTGEGRGDATGVGLGFDPEFPKDAVFEPVSLSREFEFDKAEEAELRAAPGLDRSAEFLLTVVDDDLVEGVEEFGLLEFDLLLDSGTEVDRPLSRLLFVPPGIVNTTSSRFECCSTCAVAPG